MNHQDITAGQTIAIDAMGGDEGAAMVVEGTALARKRHPDIHFIFHGDEAVLKPLMANFPILAENTSVVHTDELVLAEDKPSQAVRRGRKSSMGLAIESVKSGEASVAVSAGNTGALMAMSKVMLRTMPGIDRPALASILPTLRGESVMLDLGANVECGEENLVQFAIMGAAFSRTVLGLDKPKVALLNVGVEELKGNDAVKNAAQALAGAPLPMEYTGFVEGSGIAEGVVDVIVTDGFTGNVALKTAEGTAKLITALTRQAFKTSIITRIGYLLTRGGIRRLRRHLDPNNHNGAVFLGLNGLVVKSHGGANARGFATAINLAVEMARNDLSHMILEDMKNFDDQAPADVDPEDKK